MRTLVISDLHIGSRSRMDVARSDAVIGALAARLAGVDRLVILGDLLELRHGPTRDALAAAKPVLLAIGAALGPEGEVIVVPGNHDHTLVDGWLQDRMADAVPPPLGLEERMPPWSASSAAAVIAGALAPADCSFAYPGVWLRDDVYATHGHYLDLHTTVPTIERLAAGAMRRIARGRDRGEDGFPSCPDDYETILAPLYAWNHATAQRVAQGQAANRGIRSANMWSVLNGDGHRPVRSRMLARAFPLGIAGINALGLGPVRSDISVAEMCRAALVAMATVTRSLGLEAGHVIFGHSHRIGPLAMDDAAAWRPPGGPRLYNAGCWVYEDVFLDRSGPDDPYWPGGAIAVDDDGEPRVERLLAGLGRAALRSA
jgi:hypothetical protein